MVQLCRVDGSEAGLGVSGFRVLGLLFFCGLRFSSFGGAWGCRILISGLRLV